MEEKIAFDKFSHRPKNNYHGICWSTAFNSTMESIRIVCFFFGYLTGSVENRNQRMRMRIETRFVCQIQTFVHIDVLSKYSINLCAFMIMVKGFSIRFSKFGLQNDGQRDTPLNDHSVNMSISEVIF